ncbi:MAG: response regulator [Acidobacteria bacterium]|nr:response regulator [Acidobacteriota bacterium]MBS1864403.1 response regulator [Acidobacteriota bacterium]
MNTRELEILLVEDDPGDAELTTRSLRKEGLANKILLARDGAEALEILFAAVATGTEVAKGGPHIVLLDLQLPRVSGHAVLKAIRGNDRTRCIPVIVLTSSDHERDLTECYQLGANSYVQKPVDLGKFQDAVKQLGQYWLKVNRTPQWTACASGSAG